MNVRETREALLRAVNAHDIEAVRTFVDVTYVGRNELGVILADHRGVMEHAARLLRKRPDYRETLRIEDVEEEGETARLTTRRSESYTGVFGVGRVREARQVETWENVEGRWVIVEERCLASQDGVIPWWSWVS